ncbi:hypothetical protein HK105_204493 [Polyrhizophydium stewartii]|uniref:WLM domain-containing protein n=1 Tax=Polyrhizophydium stewartii TaxID=2732419 RepID=A0ABR4N9F3_9FUNG
MPLVQNELIGSAKALVRRRDAEAALALLHRIAAHVRPVMKRRSLRVGALEEFYPTNPGLLGINVNRGQTIRIRLRRPGDDTAFLEFDDLVGTMLHELTHNIHGPHDSAFYKYLDGLFDEYDRDRDAGFRPDGDRLGGAHAVVDLTSDETPVADADGPPWTCAACTLVNRPLALQCECCLSIRAA